MQSDTGSLAAWKVTSQMETNQLGPGGTFQAGMQVTFITGGGHSGSVFVPAAQYNPDVVAGLVQAQANLLDAVGSLSSGM